MTAADLIASLTERFGPIVTLAELRKVTGRGDTFLMGRLDKALAAAGRDRSALADSHFTFDIGPWRLTVSQLGDLVWRVKERA